MFTYRFRWDVVLDGFGFLLSGLQMTLFLSAVTLVLASLGGLIIALLNLSRFWPARAFAIGFGELIRNTPILVQLLWVYYVLPIAFQLDISADERRAQAVESTRTLRWDRAARRHLQRLPDLERA